MEEYMQKNQQYQQFVDSRTLKDLNPVSSRVQSQSTGTLLHAVIGISGESGELIDAVKKHVFYGKDLDVNNVKEELGDILFYVGMACNALGISMDDVLDQNVEKLSKRYKEKFTEKEAIERNDKK